MLYYLICLILTDYMLVSALCCVLQTRVEKTNVELSESGSNEKNGENEENKEKEESSAPPRRRSTRRED